MYPCGWLYFIAYFLVGLNSFFPKTWRWGNVIQFSPLRECNNLWDVYLLVLQSMWIPHLQIFLLLRHLNLIFSGTACLTIFNGSDAMIWLFWYLFKNIWYNCFVWWLIFTLFFGYFYLFEISTTNQNTIPIWKTIMWQVNIFKVDILWCMIFSFILVRTM